MFLPRPIFGQIEFEDAREIRADLTANSIDLVAPVAPLFTEKLLAARSIASGLGGPNPICKVAIRNAAAVLSLRAALRSACRHELCVSSSVSHMAPRHVERWAYGDVLQPITWFSSLRTTVPGFRCRAFAVRWKWLNPLPAIASMRSWSSAHQRPFTP